MSGSTTAQVAAYKKVIEEKVEQLFPEKTIRITNKDKDFITAELKTLDRRKKNEWKRKGRSELYLKLRKEFRLKYKKNSFRLFKEMCV